MLWGLVLWVSGFSYHYPACCSAQHEDAAGCESRCYASFTVVYRQFAQNNQGNSSILVVEQLPLPSVASYCP